MMFLRRAPSCASTLILRLVLNGWARRAPQGRRGTTADGAERSSRASSFTRHLCFGWRAVQTAVGVPGEGVTRL